MESYLNLDVFIAMVEALIQMVQVEQLVLVLERWWKRLFRPKIRDK